MDHRAFVRALPDATRLALTARSDRAGLAHLAVHLGAILVLGALIAAKVPLWWALMLPQGVLLVFLFTLLHETVHETPFEARWLNRWVGHAAGAVVLIPWTWFRAFHFAHHRHTQDPARDPELAVPAPVTRAGHALRVSGLPVWWSLVTTLMRNAAGQCRDRFVPERQRRRVAGEARWMLALYAAVAAASLAAGSTLALAVWLGPMLLGQPLLRLYLMAEHGRCAHVADMFENTRTTFTGALVRRLAWNMPFHAEHHAMPTVPFHRLPALHALARAHLKETEHGYLAYHRRHLAALRAGGVVQD